MEAPMTTILFCLLACFHLSKAATSWNYDLNDEEYGPNNWGFHYSECDGSRQSPINVETANTVAASYEPWDFFGFDEGLRFVRYSLENNGYFAQMNLKPHDPMFTGAGLSDWYRLFQFHFHWGDSDSPGSEHTLDNKRFPIEIHMVGVHRKFSSVAQAAEVDGGLAVLAIFLEEAEGDNPYFSHVTDLLELIKDPGTAITMVRAYSEELVIANLMPENLESFYRYNGSLTTPGCNEVVIWTIFKESVKISSSQMEQFRGLTMQPPAAHIPEEEESDNSTFFDNSTNIYDQGTTTVGLNKSSSVTLPSYQLVSEPKPVPMLNNYRPIQELNSQSVFASGASTLFAQKIFFLEFVLLTVSQFF